MAKNNNTLVFNGLMQGISWDLIKEAKEEIKRHLGEKPPTRKDILTDWIIGKDFMLQLQGELYKKGGHLFLGDNYSLIDNYNPNAYMNEDYLNWMNGVSGNNNSTNNNNNSLANAAKGAADSFVYAKYGDAAGNLIYGYATNNLGGANSDVWNKGVIGSGDNGFIGRIFGVKNDFKNSMDYATNYRNQYNIGSNASILDLIESSKNLEKSTMDANLASRTANAIWQLPWTPDPFLNAFIGYKTNFGLAKLFGYDPEENQKAINRAVEHQWALDLADRSNVINNSQELQVLGLLQHMTKNGGKLKKAHKFAEGGLLNTYDYGLEEVNAGGSHEENPNEGVVVSYAPDGLPNKVEEGETIHNDYVYSKRLEANKKVLNSNLLDEKYEGKSFADISKKLTEDRKQRPNDPISVRTNEENLARLQDALEELKLDNKTKEVKRFLGSLNSDLLNALQLEMMDEYEAYAEQLAQQLEQEDLAYQEEQAALEGMFGRGGHLKQGKTSSKISATEPIYDAEGKIIGWKQPDASTEKVLNLPVYNPNYEGALIYADDRNWFERNITSPWNTWWNNLPSQEFSWAVRNLTPVGYVDAAINGDTEALLERALFSGLLGKARKASKVVDNTDDALRLMLEAQLGENTTKEVTKEAAKNSLKWLKSLGIGVGAIGLPLAGFYVTDIEKNKDKYDLKALERGRSIGDTIVGDWQFKGDTVINTKTGEKIYSKGGHINLWDNKLSLSRYEAIKALYDLAYNNRYGNNRAYYNYPKFTDDYIQQLSALDKFNSEDTFRLLYKDLYPYLNTKFTETVAPISSSLNSLPNAIWSSHEILPKNSVPNNVEYNLGYTNPNYNSNLEDLLLKNILSYKPLRSEENKEKPTGTKKRNSVKTTNLTIPNTPLPSSNTTVSEPLDLKGLPIIPNQGASSSIYNSFKTIFDPYIQNALMGPKPYVEEEPVNNPNPNIKPKPEPEPEQKDKPNYLSYLRYAPILGSLGLVLSDTLGLTNQPDYSNIDMYRRAVDSIGGVNFVPIGGYLLYTPIDREYIANQQLAQAASYNRSLNNVNPVGSYILGLINDAKVRDQIGNMYINAAAQDEKDRLAVAEYNRGIDITNARNSLAAQSENARLRALRANEYQKIATMRDNERNIAEAARAANYDKFITNIGNLGKEEFAFNLVDSNAALLGYYTDRTGRARYRMPAFIKPDGFEAYKQYLKSHGVDEKDIDLV